MALEVFSYGFMQRALLGGLLVAPPLALLGVYLALRRNSLLGDSFAHVAFAGVALGIFLGVSPVGVALLLCVLGGVAIHLLQRRGVFGDLGVGLLYAAGLTAAVLLVSLARGFTADLLSVLFGSILTISDGDLLLMAAAALPALALLVALRRPMFHVLFQEEAARVSGAPVEGLNLLLMVLAGVAVVLALKVAGVLLAAALLIVPPAAALLVARSFRATLLAACLFALLSVLAGLLLSATLDLAPGGSIVAVSLLLFALGWGARAAGRAGAA